MNKFIVRVALSRTIEVSEEELKYLRIAKEEGDTQMFLEITEIELGEMSVTQIAEPTDAA